MPADDLTRVRVYRGHPLPGSPAGQLRDVSAQIIAAGTLPRCPHPDQPAFCYLPAALLSCGECTYALLAAADLGQPGCQHCGAPATATMFWVVGDIPCFGPLCQPCQDIGLVPVTPN